MPHELHNKKPRTFSVSNSSEMNKSAFWLRLQAVPRAAKYRRSQLKLTVRVPIHTLKNNTDSSFSIQNAATSRTQLASRVCVHSFLRLCGNGERKTPPCVSVAALRNDCNFCCSAAHLAFKPHLLFWRGGAVATAGSKAAIFVLCLFFFVFYFNSGRSRSECWKEAQRDSGSVEVLRLQVKMLWLCQLESSLAALGALPFV